MLDLSQNKKRLPPGNIKSVFNKMAMKSPNVQKLRVGGGGKADYENQGLSCKAIIHLAGSTFLFFFHSLFFMPIFADYQIW